MKKIRFIKENDLFDWRVGDILAERENGDWPDQVEIGYRSIGGYAFTFDTVIIPTNYLIKKGYAKEVKEPNLIDKVDEIVDEWVIESGGEFYRINKEVNHGAASEDFNKYQCIKLYDHIVEELNEGWEWEHGAKGWEINHRSKITYYVEYQAVFNPITKYAKSNEICQAMIDSKVFRPYLNKIFSVK